ncbi:YceI family protein [Marinibactrum halimedae]|uniref:Polyisoprenoid-binding protein n=1 Tax=Marinibactrum halimedae TaxID=1444977 RepID=A0AA37T2N9_9GAMM|nr:YceI family protein [Marinibactrum halimedae]MCD9458814.1 YceI family protein [Marinibactrum halimedae]GLS25373.1 polyisoprenoid-binding protein [Marinibactrum halimedae]
MKKLIAAAILAAAAPLVSAADYTFDKVHTQILFSVSHMGFSNSNGAFVDFDGSFSFDEKDYSKSKVEVTIDTKSIDMNDATWNDHMMSEKWFNVAKFPTMMFKSKSVKKTGDKMFDVMGDLTLKGVTKSVTLKTKLNKVGTQMGKEKAGFSATATIDRTTFGMDTFAPMIGAEIPIRIEVEGVKK